MSEVREIELNDEGTRTHASRLIGDEAMGKLDAAGFHILPRDAVFWLLSSASNLHPSPGYLKVRV